MIRYQDPGTGRGRASVEFLQLGQSCHYERISSVTVLIWSEGGQSGFRSC